ncbi:hypothetical protein CSQ85_05905 [Bifidobacterium rousetti]|uniref:hypothetical protein n=1 Tax=Bifidobacterium rousetti TaxID=2045439 RepID=UPI001239A013|nr:hypothetical protein [Bifidobacterium rousetti]KAA8819114.1 hypothetical protein CSQ85_05905 [Bifidobacterium rousetti]
MYASAILIATLTTAIGVGALFLWREPTAAPYGWGVNGIAADPTDSAADGPAKTGVDAAIAAVVARTKGGGSAVDAFQDQGGIRFATPQVSPARAAAVLRARAGRNDTDEDIERTAKHLAAACRLSERLGCAVSHCLEAVAANHRRESKAYDLKQQAFAGPKASIKLLSALPLITIIASELMGSHSARFLLTNPIGWGCLVIGLAWYGAGMLWTHRMLGAFGRNDDTDENLPIALEMLRAALSQGSSIPSALVAVGTVLEEANDEECGEQDDGGYRPLARGMRESGLALTRGASWKEAWLGANAVTLRIRDERDAEDGRKGRRRGRRSGGDGRIGDDAEQERRMGLAALHPSMLVICDCLGEAWSHGASPTDRLTLAAREYDREQLSMIEQEAAKLSVKLLVPTALCFLPAFISIGIVPAIASTLWG